MKICFVTPDFVQKGKISTGLPHYLYRVAKALQVMGHTPIIITAGNTNEHLFYDNIEVFRKNCEPNYIFKSSCLNYVARAFKMSSMLNKEVRSLCKKREIDIIQFASLYGLAMLYKQKTPSIIRLSSYAKKTFENSQAYSKIEISVQAFIERIAAINVGGIISPSNVMAKAYSKDVKRKVTTIETPFFSEEIKCDNKIYDEMFHGKKYILFFGSLYDVKGIYVIIKGIRQYLKENTDYCFGFVGNVEKHNGKNPLEELYRESKEYKDRIIYSKALKQELLLPIILNAECIVLPSLMENLPNACIEAMALGKVVIGSDGASFEQLIVDGKSGFLAIPGNTESLYKKIKQATSLSKSERNAMELLAAERIHLLEPQRVVKRLVRYYTYIINK